MCNRATSAITQGLADRGGAREIILEPSTGRTSEDHRRTMDGAWLAFLLSWCVKAELAISKMVPRAHERALHRMNYDNGIRHYVLGRVQRQTPLLFIAWQFTPVRPPKGKNARLGTIAKNDRLTVDELGKQLGRLLPADAAAEPQPL